MNRVGLKLRVSNAIIGTELTFPVRSKRMLKDAQPDEEPFLWSKRA